MPKVSRESAANVEDHGPVEDRHEDVDGYTINFVTFNVRRRRDAAAQGAAGRQLPCPHWGYVLQGPDDFRFADHDEVFEAGDAFYLPRGPHPARRRRNRVRPVQPGRGASSRHETMTRNFQAMMQEA